MMQKVLQKLFPQEIEQEEHEKWIEEQSIRLDERREIFREFKESIKRAEKIKK